MTTVTSAGIAECRQNRDAQNVLSILSDGLPHVFSRGEHLAKTVRTLARRGLVTIERLHGGDIYARKKGGSK
jgi:hypothetical protein